MSPRFVSFAGLAAFALALAVAPGASATTAVRLSDEQLVDQSDLIFTGECLELRSEWRGRDLVTVATIAVDDMLLGSAGPTVDVVLPGGADANRAVPIAVTWPGAPRIGIGEKVFLFVEVGEVPTIVGFSQGKFSIVADEGDDRVVSQDLSELTLVDGRGESRGKKRGESLDVFKQKIHDLVGHGRAGR